MQTEEIFIVKLPLNVELWQQHILDRRFEYCREIYNNLRSKIIRILHYYQNTKEWKEIDKITDYKEKSKRIQEFIKKHNLPFSEYGLICYVSKFLPRYKQYGINSTILENISGNLWRGLEKYLYGKGKKLAYKEKDDFNVYKTRKKSGTFNGIKIDLTKSTLTLNINGKTGKNGKYMTIPFIINSKSDYEMFCFTTSNEIREVIIQREWIRGKWKYYVSFSIKGKI